MEDVYLAIIQYDPHLLNFTFSDDNSKQLIGRVSLTKDISSFNAVNSANIPPAVNTATINDITIDMLFFINASGISYFFFAGLFFPFF